MFFFLQPNEMKEREILFFSSSFFCSHPTVLQLIMIILFLILFLKTNLFMPPHLSVRFIYRHSNRLNKDYCPWQSMLFEHRVYLHFTMGCQPLSWDRYGSEMWLWKWLFKYDFGESFTVDITVEIISWNNVWEKSTHFWLAENEHILM